MPTKISRVTLKGTVDSSGEVSVVSENTYIGLVKAVSIEYPDNSVEVDITTVENVNQTILELSASSTDEVYYPRTDSHDTDGSSGGSEVCFAISGRLKLECANGTEDDEVKVNVLVEEF
ncbi:MAG: hypothetical protein ACOCTT_03435 [archaeon]